ncbi:dTDP-glucose 4 [Entamoeba marina]
MGTHVLLEIAKNHKIKRFIHVSTDEVYGQIVGDSATETSLLNPTNPYSATKAGAEFIARAFYQSFNVPVIITRGNNVYGPHQFPEKLIPKFITLLDRGMNCPIHGEGIEKRSFIYVLDVVRAFDLILKRGVVGQIYNIGTTDEISNNEVVEHLLIYLELNQKKEIIEFIIYTLDVTKLQELGWSPEVSFKEGLKETIDWYRKYQNNWERTNEALVPHPRFGQ